MQESQTAFSSSCMGRMQRSMPRLKGSGEVDRDREGACAHILEHPDLHVHPPRADEALSHQPLQLLVRELLVVDGPLRALPVNLHT